jgi:hypothetical protein
MQKITMAIAIGVVLAATACKSGGTEGKNMFSGNIDAQVEKLLGGKDVYADAQRIIPVIVNSEQGSGEKKENLENYAIAQKGKALTPEQIKKLQTIIFNTGTYDFNVQKKCMFQPYVGFIFEKDGKQAHALFCFSCNEVSFGRDAKAGNLEDFDAARKDMLALSREVFPGDAALTRLGNGK